MRKHLSTFRKAFPTFIYHSPDNLEPSNLVQEVDEVECSVAVATLALGSRPRQRGCKVMARGSPGAKARGSPGVKAKGSPGVTSHTPRNVRKCEGVNPHTPKATPTLGDGVLVDSRNFREQLQGSKLNGSWRYLYHWKALEA
jgi:hypothetical protein